MRLKLKNDEKIKTRFLGTLLVFLCSFVFLYSMSLNVHAEGANSYPLPYGAGSDYGYGDFPLTESIVSEVNTFLSDHGVSSNALLINEIASDNSYISFYYVTSNLLYACNNESQWPGIAGDSVIFARSDSNGNYCSGGIVTYTRSSGSISYIPDQYIDGRIDIRWLISNGSLPSGTVIRFYPVYYNANSNITGYGWVGNSILYDLSVFYFDGDTSSGGSDDFTGSASGHLTPKSSVDGQGFDIDFDFFIDMNPLQILGEEIRDGIHTLTEKVEDGFDTVLGSIQGAWGWLKSNTDSIVSKIQELAEDAKKPTSQQLEDALDNSTVVGGMVDVAQSGKTFLDSLTASGIQVPSAEDMDFDYTFTWKEYKPKFHSFRTHSSTIHIVFSWYESIRSKVLLVLGVFMTIGFTVYLIKQIPNLIAGVSGGASAGVSISEFNNNSKGVKK